MTSPLFDSVIHPPNRLKICAFLEPLREAQFQVIREELEVSDSVLSKQLRHLEDAGYIKFLKNSVDGRQRKWVALTPSGRRAYTRHIAELERIVFSDKS